MTISEAMLAKFENRTATLGVIGLGYVGLPLAVEMARSGYRTIGFDVDPRVVEGVQRGKSHILDVRSEELVSFRGAGLLSATTELARMAECDAISICVPTPLSKTKDPDLSYIVSATHAVRQALRPGKLIILESTTYPGTTREAMLPVLEASGLRVGVDFFLCFSPERVDPGNPVWQTRNTPKVIGGITSGCTTAGRALYERIFSTVVPVTTAEAAELVKLHENTFRMINIALVNELAQICDRLDVDVWEVIDAAATKPFGFMKFTPGPGLGGHCIPLDPHYLSWKMRTLSFKTRMIDLSSEINAAMPAFVVQKVADALNEDEKSIKGSQVLLLGIAYKKDIDDIRESPALEIIGLLQDKGATVLYHDPHCPRIANGHGPVVGSPTTSSALTPQLLRTSDCVVIVTDHTAIDYESVARHARLVVDTRGALRGIRGAAKVAGLSQRFDGETARWSVRLPIAGVITPEVVVHAPVPSTG